MWYGPASQVHRFETHVVAIKHPVCVDLDGTLIAGDLLWESFVAFLMRQPFSALVVLTSLLKGRARFKQRVAEHQRIDPASLPYRQDLLEHLESLNRQGVHLVLATASDEAYARSVADHLAIFSDVIASNGRTNLSGQRKAAALVGRYGNGGFHYIGNDWSDVPVWRVASEATVVSPSLRLERYVRARHLVNHVRGTRKGSVATLARALRPQQWATNLLVFVPLVAGHRFFRMDLWAVGALTFVAFSLCASAIYLLTDIFDLEADRLHKRMRPFATGDLSIPVGLATAAALMVLSLTVAVLGVSWRLALVMAVYVIMTTAYSVSLKRQPVVDVLVMAGLYVLRIVAGEIVTQTPVSTWLLGLPLFIFLSVAFVKRYVELVTVIVASTVILRAI
jgi:phosphoserine phosphatase